MNATGTVASSSGLNSSRESSITVAVRVRPFTPGEENNLIKLNNEEFFLGDGSLSTNNAATDTPSKKSNLMPRGIRKIINVVDDRMLIFDPPETNPLIQMQRNAFPNTKATSRIREHRFVFDKLFDIQATQEDVYNNTTRPLLDSVLDGFNATVFAYGATGCGKTHTISGTPLDPGVIFLTMKELYEKIEGLADTKLFDVSMSFLEIYNETIRDLLNPETNFKRLVLREDANKKISVSNLSSHKPKSVQEVMDLILVGNQNRTSSPTEANATSSRSHAVLQINVVQRNRTADISEEHTYATLSIIDLAGSERAAATKNRGARLNEGANINKSLLALGNCINALCDPRRRNHVPYRDSKLTRLLKFSLGGNCKTVMIVCVSPSSQHYDETLNTLKYADRAKEIKTKLIRNQHNLDRHVGSYLKMITQQKQEIEDLRAREQKVVESTIAKQNTLSQKCLNVTMDNISNLKASLSKQHQEKWKKYFFLAKRKLLLLQKLEMESLVKYLHKLSKSGNINGFQNIVNLSEQLISKITTGISDLESQYSRPNEIDYIFNESTLQMLKKLKEQEGWSDHNTVVFDSLVACLRDSLEREILFNSSILFDHLVHEIRGFDFFPKSFIDMLATYSHSEKENMHEYTTASLSNAINGLTKTLEEILDGEYDTAIENVTSSFMQRKLKEQEMQANKVNNHSIDPSIVIPKPRDCKRGSNSPLKSSPPRDFKKSITKKNGSSISPAMLQKQGKKVRWDVPNQDSTLAESDVSIDEQNTILKSDYEDDSPIGNNIIDKTNMIDDLDLKFDPTLDSPPLAQLLKDSMNRSLMADLSKGRNKHRKFQPLTNRKLSTNENSEPLTKLPLLNKQASTKITNSMQPTTPNEVPESSPNYLPGTQTNTKFKMNTLGAPSRVINRYNTYVEDDEDSRDIESNGSEKVE
ncbi:DEHA2A09812p [Debaryomyces hansenii CBS767]|uniref:Kinesin-like protein n=1 Tax=Debaryomyces hansenii (strain ATCC 36239 / CBS 767 / BCRC 21394 / JCM 1990 / NBRC 0083 / IGC 2968) TaxID=284592 RepID=B5RSU2_DEBHA|nr:DEHA2A09812p [Debaryomyces hansenii CBS767]CAR65398.1 DEHA2A09812p [Debaryomyces hansenii CBS767]|eukprot:XP_002770021.1 DEHA2A09812p [Debaryomyces hansenii CBS767]